MPRYARITYILFTYGVVLTNFWVAPLRAETAWGASVRKALVHSDAKTLALVHFKGREMLRIVFDTALELSRVNAPSAFDLRRAESILRLHVMVDPNEVPDLDFARTMVDTTNAILALPLSEITRANILEQMNAFDLWRPEHAWFLATFAATEDGLRNVEAVIDDLARGASIIMLEQLGAGVRQIQPYTPRSLAMLHRLAQADATDLTALFLFAAHEFDRTVADPLSKTPVRYPDMRFSAALNELRHALREKEVAVTEAFAKARAILPRSRFFSAVFAAEFGWTARGGWRYLAQRPDADADSGAQILAFSLSCRAQLRP